MAKIPKKPKRIELTDEERELFLSAFFQGEIPACKDVKKAEPKKLETKKTDSKKSEQTKTETIIVHKRVHVVDKKIGDEERALFLEAVEEGFGPSYAEHKLPDREQSKIAASSRKKNLVDAIIDLHGMTAENAELALHRFIDKEHHRGSKTVLVVHGKGRGVLKKAVWAQVEQHHLVADFQVAAGRLGGHGAIIVRIKSKSKRA